MAQATENSESQRARTGRAKNLIFVQNCNQISLWSKRMGSISDEDYRHHMESVIADGFVLDPPGYERLAKWTSMLTNLVAARANFIWVRDRKVILGDLDDALQGQAFFVAAVVAYGRCYASSGPGFPKLDPKRVYSGSFEGMLVHRRLIEIRNKLAAHSDSSDLVRLTIAVKEEDQTIYIKHLSTAAMPSDEIPDFLEAVEQTEHFVTIALNKLLDHLGTQMGKPILLA